MSYHLPYISFYKLLNDGWFVSVSVFLSQKQREHGLINAI